MIAAGSMAVSTHVGVTALVSSGPDIAGMEGVGAAVVAATVAVVVSVGTAVVVTAGFLLQADNITTPPTTMAHIRIVLVRRSNFILQFLPGQFVAYSSRMKI
jgi:hypothetical protein